MTAKKIGDYYDPVDTDIDLEANVMKNAELSTSASVERELTENPDDMVNTEEEMDFGDLTITGNYSDYDILEEEKNYYQKQQRLGQKQKINMERGITVNSLQ